MALIQAAEVLDSLELEGDEATGANIVKVAVEVPSSRSPLTLV